MTRSILNAEKCKRDLLCRESMNLATIVPCILLCAIAGGMLALIIWLSDEIPVFDSMFDSLTDFCMAAMVLFLILLDLFPFVSVFGLVFHHIRKRYLIRHNRFYVVTDTVSGIGEDEYVKHRSMRDLYWNGLRSGRRLENAIYFSRYGRVVVDREELNYASYGDSYYLVFYKGQKGEPALLYNQKIYEWQDLAPMTL